MTAYLEKQANKFARNNVGRFEELIRKFRKEFLKDHNKEICDEIHETYSENLCKHIKPILTLSHLFEDNNKRLKQIKEALDDSDTFDRVHHVVKSELRPLRVFFKVTSVGYKDVISVNEKETFTFDCLSKRIEYHLECQKYATKYNPESHVHEILYNIYLYNRLLDLKKLFNSGVQKMDMLYVKKVNETLEELSLLSKKREDALTDNTSDSFKHVITKKNRTKRK